MRFVLLQRARFGSRKGAGLNVDRHPVVMVAHWFPRRLRGGLLMRGNEAIWITIHNRSNVDVAFGLRLVGRIREMGNT